MPRRAVRRLVAIGSAVTSIPVGGPSTGPANSSAVCPASKNLLTAFISALRRSKALIGRFTGRVPRSGEHLVPEAALEALADRGIPFAVRGRAT